MQALRNDIARVVSHLEPIGRLNASQHLRLAISLPLRNQQALTDFLAQLQDPASPNYRKYLSPAQFTERFGPSKRDYEAVAAFARAHHLNVITAHSNRVILDVEGTVADVEGAMHVAIRTYQHPTEPRQFYAPDLAPTLDLKVPILGISGLDNYELPQPRLKVNFDGRNGPRPPSAAVAAAPNTGSGPYSAYMGNDFRTAYVPGTTLTGSGQTVGLLQFDGYTAGDITYYESLAGRSNVTLANVLLDGFSGAPTGDGGEVEVSLDIEMVISMAPGVSKIIVYEAGPTGNWHDILNRMATDNLARQISCSWYSPGAAEDPTSDIIFQEMAAQGQSFYSASGDYDAFTGLIPFPGDTPYITEVGGTQLTTSGPNAPYGSEAAWNRNNGIGTGGGVSTQYTIPAWQQGISMTSNLGSTTMRKVPDVALTADNVYVRADGEDQDVGGTSCAAPLWAGFTALVNQQAAANGNGPVGFINPAVYTIGKGSGFATAFHDTTVGNNYSSNSPSKFPAVAGYDLCTGWGSPYGTGLIYALAGQPQNLTLSIPSNAPAGTTLLTGTLSVRPAPTSNLTVSLSSSNTGLVTVPATVTIPAGQTSVTFPITILDDGLLDGSQPVTLTAASSGYSSVIATISVDDDQTAALSVSAPASAIKGSASVQGTVTISAAPAFNVTISLSSNNANAATVPASVTVPAGQTSATFPITVVNNGVFDGGQVATITAHVNNWTDGTAVISVLDNFNLGLTIPATARKGQGILSGSVQIAGTMTSGLTVSLVSNNLGRVTVPATMTIPAGQTSGTFPLTIVDNGIADGTQNAGITASASGFISTSGTIAVSDNHPSYFTISNIASPQIANSPFSVSITAYDINNTVITTYAGSVNLTAAGSSGALPVTPTSASGFVNGVWTGNVTVQELDSNVVLSAADGFGHFGSSNAFNVGYGLLDHFAWNTISSPQQALVPFPATITAQDAANNTVASYSGTAYVTCNTGASQLPISSGSIAVFSSGVWSGNIAVAQTGTGVFLKATDSSGAVSGNIYIADANNSTIRMMTPAGVVTTVAGVAQTAGTADGTGSAARFAYPYGVGVDGLGNLFVPDTANSTIRKVTPGGVVTTLAGAAQVTGTVDGAGSAARFNNPRGTVVDGNGNVFIADTDNNTIRKMTPGGVVTTIGGTPGVTGTQGGVGTAAGFNFPESVVIAANGNLYVTDAGNDRIAVGVPTQNGSQITYTWSNFVGSPGVAGGSDGTGSAATFTAPEGLALDVSGNLYVVSNDGTVRKVSPAGVVTTLAGATGQYGSTDGTGTAARFNQPYGVALDGSGNAYIADSANQTIRKMTPGLVVTTIAGSLYSQGGTDGTGSAARFSYPNGAGSWVGGHMGVSNTFNVTATAGMSVSPSTGLNASGPIGGPFAPSTTVYTISNSGTGQMNWSVSGTSTWLSFNPSGGIVASGSNVTVSVGISGAANALPVGAYGDTMSFVNNTNGLGNTALSAALNITPLVPVITSALSATGTISKSFSYQIVASNGPTSFGASGLPSGLSVNTANGMISGTPAGSGTSNVTISATNAGGTGSAILVIVVVPLPPVITSGTSVTGLVNSTFSYQITAINNPTSYSASGLPNGVNVNTASGLISGTPTVAGTSVATINAINAGGTGSASLTIVVGGTSVSYFTISNIASPQVVNVPFSVSITAYDSSNIVITNYAGTVSLSATGASGSLPVSPAFASGFVNGVWTGNVAVQAVSTNVVLGAGDGAGHTGASNAFNVGSGSLDHFAWSTISSPQQILVPFAATITAQDAANNTVASYSGTAYVTCNTGTSQLPISSGSIAVFLSGVWSGNIAVAQTGTGVFLKATDSSGAVSGNIYIADSNNSTIRQMTPAGVVTTLAGLAQTSGTSDGTGSAARFLHPYGVTVDSSGNIYAVDTANDTVRKITSGGVVTTIAGKPGVAGTVDGTGGAAQFSQPDGIAVDGSGNLYVADTLNDTIRKIASGGVVTTIGGTPGVSGTQSGSGSTARFSNPEGISVLPNGTLYVADSANNRISMGVPTQSGSQTVYSWSNFVGTPGTAGGTDGTGSAAHFTIPEGLALDGSGNLYVVSNSDTVRRVTPGGVVTTLAGTSGAGGSTDGTGSAARFNQPFGVALDGSGNAYIIDSANQTIRKMTSTTVVTTIAGSLYSQGGTDGTGSAARFSYPNGAGSWVGGHTGISNSFNILAAGIMSVSPVGGLSASGPIGGPFTSAPSAYAISNVGTDPLNWSVSGTSSWLTYAPSSGALASGSSVTVTVTIGAAAGSLGVGNYGDTINFANTTNGSGNSTRAAALAVTLPPPVITSALSATGTCGRPFSYQILASNNPVSYSSGKLPSGLYLNLASGSISGTAMNFGTTSVLITASNAGGANSATLLIVINAAYAGWQNQWFTPIQLADPTISSDTATPAGDGIPNLLKYALNLSPWANGMGAMPAGAIMTIGGTNYLTLTYTQNIFATDITYIPEVGGNLQTWNSGLGFIAPVSVTPNADGVTESVVVQDLTPEGAAPRFIRLRVTRP